MTDREPAIVCPAPLRDYPHIVMAHGGGGALTRDLITNIFEPAFHNRYLSQMHDGATFRVTTDQMAFTTDNYVVSPLFFPGGDIGTLAVCGTVNDLAMCGARPLYLSAGFVIEEGLPMETLIRTAQSMGEAAARANVQIVTGDIKVVDRGKGDGLYINTSGVGAVISHAPIGPDQVRPGDAIVISGDIGRHGVTVLAEREGLSFESAVESDVQPVADPVLTMLEEGIALHCLRDLTRGGLATALIEIAEQAGHDVEMDEMAVPVAETVRGASEILGLDPLYIANEGCFVAFVPEREAAAVLNVLNRADGCFAPSVIGRVAAGSGQVSAVSPIGGRRALDLLSGEQMPRIC